MAYGLNGEKIRLNHHGSQEKISNYSGNYGSPHNEKDPYKYGAQYDLNGHLIRKTKQDPSTKIGTGVLKQMQDPNTYQVPASLQADPAPKVTSISPIKAEHYKRPRNNNDIIESN